MNMGLVLTFCCFGFMILLFVSYYLQQRSSAINNQLYRLTMFNVSLFILTEIVATIYFFNNSSDLVFMLLLRLHWVVGMFCFLSFFLYTFCFNKSIKAKTVIELLKTNNLCKVLMIFTLICLVIYGFVPFNEMTKETFTYLPAPASYFAMGYAFILTGLICFLLIKNKDDYSQDIKNATIMLVIQLVIIVTLQIVFQQVAFFAVVSSLHMYFLYFYIENPDLIMFNSMEKMKKDVERSSMAKTDFLSNMSHEIISPMNSIVGYSDTILNEPTFNVDNARKDIEHITTAGKNLLDIVNNILDISKIETGSESLEEKDYSIGNIIMELLSIIESRLDNRPVKFITEIDNQIPSKLYGDSTKLFQVLLNILTNAVKYTEVGNIHLNVTKEIKNEYVTLKFKVSDTGFGIKKEDYDNLFQKFSRLTTATTNEIEGTGLGLAITKRYVDLLGGKIWFESEYGAGTTFYVEVTQKIIDSTPIGDIRENKESEAQEDTYLDLTGKKILVVDDNMLNIKVAKRIFSKYKFTIDSVTCGRDCVFKIKEGQQYDMIFLDHMMPEMDGIEVVHILKKLQGYNIPPVVALTANAITGVKDMYLREGFDEYLSKPINLGELNHLINRYFSSNNE